MRVLLFTDTLGDVNGVSRFICNIAVQSLRYERELTAITSTRFRCPDQPNIVNLAPIYARPMPKYENLDIVVAPRRRLLDFAVRMRPDVIHISTPGPVGMVGRAAAKRLDVPLIGTYHTDFPAYIDHLFDDVACSWVCSEVMRWFYRPFHAVFTRSEEYAAAMGRVGIARERIERLLPGIDTDTFHVKHRPPDTAEFWNGYRPLGIDPDAVKVLYVGRVSVEKNLPMLARVWPGARAAAAAQGVAAQLIVVGDGPYRMQMERELGGASGGVAFLGFRHGEELSRIYAACDLFAFPSTTDTLGQVVMEAQSAGLPVIVTDQGGPSGVVDRGRTGFVLGAEDHAAWVRTIAELACDPVKRREMGSAAHAKIQPMSIRHSFEHFWQVHKRVVSGARRDPESAEGSASPRTS